MPFIEISGSPFHDESVVVRIHYRTFGEGLPLVFLHGGWGYEVYPFDKQIAAFGDRVQIVIPDRSGYGRSSAVEYLPPDFHQRAARESLLVLDALGIGRAVLWGHSDGAVIAANMGIYTPSRFAGLILEAFHYDRAKPGSRRFFHNTSYPDDLSERTRAVLAGDHGEERWRHILKAGGAAWLELAKTAHLEESDLFGGRLAELSVPTLFVHGSIDPRTEPGELETVRQLLPDASFAMIDGGAHAPHAERDVWHEVNRTVEPFIARMLETRQ
jgi:pimeloyl-ACP methyl ester carboxylesterase